MVAVIIYVFNTEGPISTANVTPATLLTILEKSVTVSFTSLAHYSDMILFGNCLYSRMPQNNKNQITIPLRRVPIFYLNDTVLELKYNSFEYIFVVVF